MQAALFALLLTAFPTFAHAAEPNAITAPGPAGPLSGTLLAAGPTGAPIVLIVPGSGPVDRDGNGPGGMRAATYRLLAEGLAARGIASVRIDKRGLFGSRDAADPNRVTIDDYAADLRAWVGAIRARTGAGCVWVLGHSEGGLVALAAAHRDAAPFCGLVLVATAGRPLGEVLRDQLRANPANAPLLREAEAAIDHLERGQRVDAAGMTPALRPLFRPAVQGLLVSEFALDPAALVAGLRVPVLVLQGARDLQVSVEDARRLAGADPAARLVLLADTNHVLKRVASDDRAANVAAYADPALPLAPGVVDAIAGFIAAPHAQ